jgi:hypothetical protein
MPDQPAEAHCQLVYEGFEIHVTLIPLAPDAPPHTYIGYVCHPGADPALPDHIVPFRADSDARFTTPDDAARDAFQIGRSIIDGTHPDLSVLSLVTHGY